MTTTLDADAIDRLAAFYRRGFQTPAWRQILLVTDDETFERHARASVQAIGPEPIPGCHLALETALRQERLAVRASLS